MGMMNFHDNIQEYVFIIWLIGGMMQESDHKVFDYMS